MTTCFTDVSKSSAITVFAEMLIMFMVSIFCILMVRLKSEILLAQKGKRHVFDFVKMLIANILETNKNLFHLVLNRCLKFYFVPSMF